MHPSSDRSRRHTLSRSLTRPPRRQPPHRPQTRGACHSPSPVTPCLRTTAPFRRPRRPNVCRQSCAAALPPSPKLRNPVPCSPYPLATHTSSARRWPSHRVVSLHGGMADANSESIQQKASPNAAARCARHLANLVPRSKSHGETRRPSRTGSRGRRMSSPIPHVSQCLLSRSHAPCAA